MIAHHKISVGYCNKGADLFCNKHTKGDISEHLNTFYLYFFYLHTCNIAI